MRVAPFLAKLRNKFESALDIYNPTKHHTRTTSIDVRNFGLKLWQDGSVDWRIIHPNQYLARDVFTEGMGLLAEAIESFNSQVVDPEPNQPNSFTPTAEHDDREADGENSGDYTFINELEGANSVQGGFAAGELIPDMFDDFGFEDFDTYGLTE